jgi:hypothetical protein
MKAWKIIHTHPDQVMADAAILERLSNDPALPGLLRLTFQTALRTKVHPLLNHTGDLWEEPEMLRYVLRQGLPVNREDDNTVQPLMVAMGIAPPWGRHGVGATLPRQWFHLQCLQVLIEEGADLRHKVSLPNGLGVRGQARNAFEWATHFKLGEMEGLLRPATEQCILEKALESADRLKSPVRRL